MSLRDQYIIEIRRIRGWKHLVQTTTETRASNTYVAANTIRLNNLVAGTKVEFEARLVFQGNATCGVKLEIEDTDSVLNPGSVIEMQCGTGTTHRSGSGDISGGNISISHPTQSSATFWISGSLDVAVSGEVYIRS